MSLPNFSDGNVADLLDNRNIRARHVIPIPLFVGNTVESFNYGLSSVAMVGFLVVCRVGDGRIREDVKAGVYVENLTEEYVSTIKDLKHLLIKVIAAYSYNPSTKAAIIIDSVCSRTPVDDKESCDQANSEDPKYVEPQNAGEAWDLLHKDCIYALEACVEGELKHFHKASELRIIVDGCHGPLVSFCAPFHSHRVALWKVELALSRFSSCVMLVAYGAYLFYQLKNQKNPVIPINYVSFGGLVDDGIEQKEIEVSRRDSLVGLHCLLLDTSVFQKRIQARSRN
ncbi:hypothetical protein Syun_031298 [Stephania yunnanensis]|uniref:Uncharacterized protein n=1 Tax=Stephania yunnanensis TaxID=152371 RepID=A0AAP0HFB5_9MAGN